MPESSQQESPVYTVIISEKGGHERREVFRSGEVTVGRVHGNDLVLPRGNVSKRHARVLYREGRFIVTDLNSTNGTYVNRRRIAQATIVREEDKIYIGDFVLRVEPGAHESVAEGRGTQPDRESSEGRNSSIDWDRPSSFDSQRVSSGPPARASVSEAPAGDRISTVSHSVDDLTAPHLHAVAEVIRAVSAALGDIPVVWSDAAARQRADGIVSEAADDLMLRGAVPAGTSLEAIVTQARGELFELGPLDELLDDPAVTTISVSRYDDVAARRDDRLVRASPGFSSPASLELAVRRLCARGGAPVRQGEALIERRLPQGSLSALLGAVTSSGPLLVLRRLRRVAGSLDALVRRGTVSRAMATFLNYCVSCRINILVVGAADDGASTVMSALCGAASRERIVTLAEDDDFAPDAATRLSLSGDVDPSRILQVAAAIPEGRLALQLATPAIALAALEAMGHGASGVLASLASSDLRRALIRLPADICALRPGMSLQAASAWVQGSFDVLVEVARLRDGRPRTLRVAEVGYSDQSAPVLHDIFRFNVQRVAVGGSVEGSFGPTGYVPRVAAQLQALGANIESSMFSRPPSR